MLLRVLLLLTLFLAVPLEAGAAIPPMSKEELEQNADLIVEATVREIEKVGAERDDHCYTWQDYRAKLTVEKVRKGAEVDTIHVRYKRIVKDEKDCVGGATSYALTQGAQYELYLHAWKDGDYGFLNWAGVNIIAEQGPPLPAPPAPEPEPEPTPSPSSSAPAVAVVPKAPAKNGGCACDVDGAATTDHGRSLFACILLLGLALARRQALRAG